MREFLLGVAGFSLGILAVSLHDLSWVYAGLSALVALAFLILFLPRRERLYLGISVVLLCASLGMARTLVAPSALPEAFTPLIGTRAELEGKVIADPDIREKTQRLTIEVQQGDEKTNILVVAPLFPEIRYGETVRANGDIEPPEPFETDAGRTFRYDTFLAKDGIFVLMQRASVEVVGPREGIDHIRGTLSDLKFAGIDSLSVALPEPQASLAAGLVLGGKQGLGEELLDDFIRSGLIHIVVLSGYNVMIVAEFIMRAFGLFSKNIASYAGAFSILAFVLMAGAGPASIRAGIMAVIAVYARASGKTYVAVRALIAAALLMLLWNPLTLAHDPGFQLSFLATLGLIYGAPITERSVAFIRSAFLREIVASTIAAQIAVLPLLLYQNGLFSVVALPANVLVLPVVPVAMLLSALAGLAGFLIPTLAPALGFPAYLLLAYITSVVTFAAHLPLAAFSVPAFPFFVVIVSYALLTLLVLRNASPRRPS